MECALVKGLGLGGKYRLLAFEFLRFLVSTLLATLRSGKLSQDEKGLIEVLFRLDTNVENNPSIIGTC